MTSIRAWFRRIVAEFMAGYREWYLRGLSAGVRFREWREARLVAPRGVRHE
jgi:hypothetical protein